ncbi:HNH endonuclease [Salinisphaera sp. LB1]|uniref:HNH endonuclease n=1 Tax=Salinisphaera sp. LB1 TaxID=2183911 RepID=UPI000D708D71|nr:HNH endonuclease signature motif containing protein [Salinisphaera sp. LB1]
MNRAEKQKLYKSSRWQKLRARHLNKQPLCEYCLELEIVTSANTVDHIKPHRGDRKLFFDPNNLQSLCKLHHDSTKQREEYLGKRIGCDVNGMPFD